MVWGWLKPQQGIGDERVFDKVILKTTEEEVLPYGFDFTKKPMRKLCSTINFVMHNDFDQVRASLSFVNTKSS